MRADDLLTLYRLQNTAPKGLMPKNQLVKLADAYYQERTVGFSRQYAAMGADQSIDMLVRIWEDRTVRTGDYVILPDGNQYRIDFIQHLYDEDNLKCTDLTLVRLESNYDVATEA